MSIYYYLAASLPMLMFHHGEPLVSYSQFLDYCRRLTNSSDFHQIGMARINTQTFFNQATPTLNKWQMTDFAIRNELVKIRAKRLSLDPAPYLHPLYIDSPFLSIIKEALEESSPFHSEMIIMELQWNILDQLQSTHLFDLDFLIIYALKLQILERKFSFNKEKGGILLENIMSRSSYGGV